MITTGLSLSATGKLETLSYGRKSSRRRTKVSHSMDSFFLSPDANKILRFLSARFRRIYQRRTRVEAQSQPHTYSIWRRHYKQSREVPRNGDHHLVASFRVQDPWFDRQNYFSLRQQHMCHLLDLQGKILFKINLQTRGTVHYKKDNDTHNEFEGLYQYSIFQG